MLKKILNSSTFWSFAIGVIGITITIVIYEISNKRREPVYTILKEPTLIFDKDNASPKIKLLSNDSIIMQENVYVTTILIWNNGELEIRKEDIRKNIKIGLLNQGAILDYKITRETNPEISKFSLHQMENDLKVDWEYFDPGFGFEFQVTYSGTATSQVVVKGYVLGAEMTKVDLRPDGYLKYFAIVLLVVQLFLAVWIFRNFDRAKWKYYLSQALTLIFSLTCATWLIFRYFISGYISPF